MILLPCPFCGAKAELGHTKLPDLSIRLKISCTGPGCWATIEEWVGDEISTERILESWNRRVPHETGS